MKFLSRTSPPIAQLERTMGVERATRRALLYLVIPFWLLAGLLDWYHHRRTHIERTAGAHESATHIVMLAEAGIPALFGLFLEIDAGVLLASLWALILHELTAMWDVAYAETRRHVSPMEQHVHSFLEVGPLLAVCLLAVLHWDQAQTLVGRGRSRPRLAFRPKAQPLSSSSILALIAAITAFGVLPYGEELWRCWRFNKTLKPLPKPPVPATPTLRIPV